MTETPFQFDRPAEHGFGPRTAGQDVFAAADVQDALADRLRDEALHNLDPLDALSRHADPAWAARGETA
jgi:hypothetical protein